MAGTHSLWSPSGAKRWRTCPGSVVMNDGVPDTASKYSAEGTAYHSIAEAVLNGGEPWHCGVFVGKEREADGFKFMVNEENADFAQGYVDRIRARAHEGCIVSIEVRTDTSDTLGIPEQAGTVDARIFDITNETLEVRDLKFGAGVRVNVWDNPGDGVPRWKGVNDQLGIYGVSEWRRTLYMCHWKYLKLVIDQPRVYHLDEITLTREEVETFADAVLADAQVSYATWKEHKDNAAYLLPHLRPSAEACRWCARAGSCQARARSILELFP